MSARMVVGFDGSAEALAALRYAAARADRDGLVIAVYAEPPSPNVSSAIGPGLGAMGPPALPEEIQASAPPSPREHAVFRALPTDTIDGARLERVVVADTPARALIEAARGRRADEIVIGTRRHGRIRAAIASVSHDLIHDADRPVVIVPPPEDG
jgi:nucleotide-binding universal stress UspA family protein